MKSSFIIFILLCVFLIGCTKKQDLTTATIAVNSMVCGSCAKTIEKATYTVEGVKSVKVDIEKKTVEVKFAPLQTNVETIEVAITDAGYDANNRKRDPNAYEKLEACCKIDG
ncbi:MAG: heavy-metal-associated domain-containing protein [Ignavibacteriae bacterium]|nr:heavy-metal-associated domain-containing protein [Ignavibacteriota bacterium]